jgi:hypothetical protein
MATFMSSTSMNWTRPTLQLRLEHFTRGLTREHAHETAQVIVRAFVDQCFRVCANAPHVSSPPRPSRSSSFGHDTPAHVERRCRFTYSFCCSWAALSAAPSASATDRRMAVAA